MATTPIYPPGDPRYRPPTAQPLPGMPPPPTLNPNAQVTGPGGGTVAGPVTGPGLSSPTGALTPTTATTPATPTPAGVPQGQPGSAAPSLQTAFRDQLLTQLQQQNPNQLTLQDPFLAQQSQAFSDAQQRALARQQQSAAEQAFAGGALHTGAYQSSLAGLQQQRGEAEAQYNANLLGTARDQRMAELFQALGLAKEYEALQAQTALGQGDLALRGQLGRGQLGLGLLQALLSDRQAANQLGLNAGIAGMGFNQTAMQQLLQGMR